MTFSDLCKVLSIAQNVVIYDDCDEVYRGSLLQLKGNEKFLYLEEFEVVTVITSVEYSYLDIILTER